MDQSLCKLTIVCPPSSADRIVELMLSLDPPLAGFTTWTAEGHGFGFANATVSERVRGRVRRNLITAVIARQEAETLLSLVAEKAPVPHLAFWIEPVERFGRLQQLKSKPSKQPDSAHADERGARP